MRRIANYYTILLAILVCSSMLLTYLIVSDPIDNQSTQSNRSTEEPGVVTKLKDIREVLAPSKAIVVQQGTMHMTTNDKLVQQLSEMVSQWELEQLEPTADNPDINELLASEAWMVLTFPAEIPFNDTSRYFKSVPSELGERFFNMVLIPLGDKRQEVLFVQESTRTVYQAKVADTSVFQQLLQLYQNNMTDFIAVVGFPVANQQRVYLPMQPVQLKKEVFISGQSEIADYAKTFYVDITQVRVAQNDEFIRYHNDSSELVFYKATDVLSYYQNVLVQTQVSPSDSIRAGFQRMKFYEGWRNQWLYEGVNQITGEVSFRRYFNGYPIAGNQGASKIRINGESETAMQVSLATIDTPLTSLNQDVTLVSGEEVITALQQYGIQMNRVTDIQISYTWQKHATQPLVELLPQWYVQIDGEWRTLDSLAERE